MKSLIIIWWISKSQMSFHLKQTLLMLADVPWYASTVPKLCTTLVVGENVVHPCCNPSTNPLPALCLKQFLSCADCMVTFIWNRLRWIIIEFYAVLWFLSYWHVLSLYILYILLLHNYFLKSVFGLYPVMLRVFCSVVRDLSPGSNELGSAECKSNALPIILPLQSPK